MPQTIFTVQDLLYSLVTGTVFPDRYNLHCLAELEGPEKDELATFWLLIPTRRRSFTARCCLEMSRNTPALQFNSFFRYLLADPEPLVRKTALEGLGIDVNLGVISEILSLLIAETNLTVRKAAVRTIGQFLLTSELQSWSNEVKRDLLLPLLQILESSQEPLELQCCAIESIGFSSDVDARYALEHSFVSEIDDIRVSTLKAMGKSSDQNWESYVLEAFDDLTLKVKIAALRAAGELQLKSFLDICLTIIEYERAVALRLEAIRTLGCLDSAVAYRALLAATLLDDPEQVTAAKAALDGFSGLDDEGHDLTDTEWD